MQQQNHFWVHEQVVSEFGKRPSTVILKIITTNKTQRMISDEQYHKSSRNDGRISEIATG